MVHKILIKYPQFKQNQNIPNSQLEIIHKQLQILQFQNLNFLLDGITQPEQIIALPITIQKQFTLFFIIIPSGQKFDWHDHPKMIGMTKCLYGNITITSINKNDLIKVNCSKCLELNNQNDRINYYHIDKDKCKVENLVSNAKNNMKRIYFNHNGGNKYGYNENVKSNKIIDIDIDTSNIKINKQIKQQKQNQQQQPHQQKQKQEQKYQFQSSNFPIPSPSTSIIMPTSYNIHRISANNLCVFFDLLIPDYPDNECEFYETISLQQQSNKQGQQHFIRLNKIPQSKQNIKAFNQLLKYLKGNNKNRVKNVIIQ